MAVFCNGVESSLLLLLVFEAHVQLVLRSDWGCCVACGELRLVVCLHVGGFLVTDWFLSRRVFHLERFEEEHVRGGEKRESCEKETEFEEEAQR